MVRNQVGLVDTLVERIFACHWCSSNRSKERTMTWQTLICRLCRLLYKLHLPREFLRLRIFYFFQSHPLMQNDLQFYYNRRHKLKPSYHYFYRMWCGIWNMKRMDSTVHSYEQGYIPWAEDMAVLHKFFSHKSNFCLDICREDKAPLWELSNFRQKYCHCGNNQELQTKIN